MLQCLDHHLDVQLIPVCANKSRQQRDSREEARAGRVCVADISRTGAEAECVPVNPSFGWEIAETGSGGLASQTRRRPELANGERGLLYPLIPRRQVGIVAAGKKNSSNGVGTQVSVAHNPRRREEIRHRPAAAPASGRLCQVRFNREDFKRVSPIYQQALISHIDAKLTVDLEIPKCALVFHGRVTRAKHRRHTWPSRFGSSTCCLTAFRQSV